MSRSFFRRYLGFVVVVAAATLGGASIVAAETLVSPNYQMNEAQFGSGTEMGGCSDQYCARISIGDMAEGAPPRPGTAEFDEDVGTEPLIEVIIEAGESNLGVLTTESTATKETSVKVRNHLSGGYTLQIVGDPPKYDGYVLETPSVPIASMPGTEQFAINLAANSTPAVGEYPDQDGPDDTLIYEVDERYSMSDLFKYTSGDTIARSMADSGRIDYTISMIVNIANSTPAGHYVGDFNVLIVPAY